MSFHKKEIEKIELVARPELGGRGSEGPPNVEGDHQHPEEGRSEEEVHEDGQYHAGHAPIVRPVKKLTYNIVFNACIVQLRNANA